MKTVRKLWVLWAAALLAIFPRPIGAMTDPFGGSFMGGNELHQLCRSDNSADRLLCLGYVVGLADAVSFVEFGRKEKTLCTPENSIRGQLRDVVVKHLEENPEKRHFAASSLGINALRAAFPCR